MPYKDPEKKRQHEREYWHRSSNAKARSKRWVEANREKHRATNRDLYESHKEQRIAKVKKYHMEHPEIVEKSKKNFLIHHTREEIREKNIEWYRKNRDKQRVKTAEYRQKNKAKDYERQKRWRDANPNKACAIWMRRRMRIMSVTVNDFTSEQWTTMKWCYGYYCIYCGRYMQRLGHDHVCPVSKNGAHTASNVVPCCRSCNSKKGDREPLPVKYTFPPLTECG